MKIPADTRLRQYELTYILPASFTSDEAGKVHDRIKTTLEKQKGTIVSQEDWGKLSFAYKIKQGGKTYTEGVYTHLVIEIDRKHVPALEHALVLDQQLLRYLLVIAEPTPVMTAPKAESITEEVVS